MSAKRLDSNHHHQRKKPLRETGEVFFIPDNHAAGRNNQGNKSIYWGYAGLTFPYPLLRTSRQLMEPLYSLCGPHQNLVGGRNGQSSKAGFHQIKNQLLIPKLPGFQKTSRLNPSPATGSLLEKVLFKICKASSPTSVNFKYFSRNLSRAFPPQNCLITRNNQLTVAGTNINKNPCPDQGSRLPVPGPRLYFAKNEEKA